MQLRHPLQELYESLKVAELFNLSSMSALHGRFTNFARIAQEGGEANLCDAATKAAQLVERVVLEEIPNPKGTMDTLRQTVEILQTAVVGGSDAKSLVFPRELEAAGPKRKRVTGPSAVRIRAFIARTRERLETLKVRFLALESDPHDPDAIGTALRIFAAMRWQASFLDLKDIASLSTDTERLFLQAQNRSIQLVGHALDVAFDVAERIPALLDAIETALTKRRKTPSDATLEALLTEIRAVSEGKWEPLSKLPINPAAAPNKKLGEILIESGIATQESLEAALTQQKEVSGKKMLGDILVEQATVSRSGLEYALETQQQDPQKGKLGDILVNLGAVAPKDVETALKRQQEAKPPKLGESLVRLGQASAKAVAQALRSQVILKKLLRFGMIEPATSPSETGITAAPLTRSGTAETSPEPPEGPAPVYLEGDPQKINEFVERAREHLQAADLHLLNLESEPDDAVALSATFRAFHSIDWVAGYLGLEDIRSYAAEAENLIDRIRKGEIKLEGPSLDAAFDAVEVLKRLVAHVADALATKGPVAREAALPDWLADLKSAAGGEKKEPKPEPTLITRLAAEKKLGDLLLESGIISKEALEEALRQQKEAPARRMLGDILVEQIKVSRSQLRKALEIQRQDPSRKLGDILVEMGAIDPEDLQSALDKQKVAKPPKLGEILVKSGLASAKSVAQALRSQKALKELVRLGTAAAVTTAFFMSADQAFAQTSFDGGSAMVTISAEANLDTDLDGLSDDVEGALGTNPQLADSDSDTIADGVEVSAGLDPGDASDADQDIDGDRLSNVDEVTVGSQPFVADTDADGYWDGLEVERGTDPDDAASHPVPATPTDVNADGDTNAVDVQMVINAALGMDTEAPGDVNQAGGVNALDVQEAINKALSPDKS
ncbi:MAG: Hpt domain-containing protein [Candidatus Hydrogenedentes bacterium]|nr:Hpt domain-containing protein [Candidatus Hydrogenedentota bacterium]